MIPLYLDEDSEAHALADGLRAAGVVVLRTSDAGNRGLDDAEQLAFATTNGMAIVTANIGDYARLDGVWRSAGLMHSGIVVRTQGLGVGEDLRRLLAMQAELEVDGLVSRVEFLSRWR